MITSSPSNTVVLAGANGYLGSYVCRELLARDLRVIALVHPHARSTVFRHPAVEYHECDIGERLEENGRLDRALQSVRPLAIINCAAILGSHDSGENERVNAEGVSNLADLATANGIEKFVHVSSVVTIKARRGPYGDSKQKGDKNLIESGLSYTIFVPAMVLGPESLGLNRMLKNIFRFPLIVPIIGSGNALQHPIFVEDFARIIVDAIFEKKCSKKVYQVGGDQPLSFTEFVREILEIRGRRKLLVRVPVWFARMMGWFFSRVQDEPVFTAEHVVGVIQDSVLSTDDLHRDLAPELTPFRRALEYSLSEIGDDWGSMLQARPERVMVLTTGEFRASVGESPEDASVD
jgi:NADH dehydrogenase